MSSRRIVIPPGFTPDGSEPLTVNVSFTLVTVVNAARGKYRAARGFFDGRIIAGTTTLQLTGLSADVLLPPNAEILPNGTLYKVTITDGTATNNYYVEVKAGGTDLPLAELILG